MTWDEVCDQITYSKMEALYRYWERHPPTHLVTAAMAGIKSKPRKNRKR